MKFEIEFREITVYNFIIEADTEEQAESKAYEFYEQALANDSLSDYGYDNFTEVSEIYKLEN